MVFSVYTAFSLLVLNVKSILNLFLNDSLFLFDIYVLY